MVPARIAVAIMNATTYQIRSFQLNGCLGFFGFVMSGFGILAAGLKSAKPCITKFSGHFFVKSADLISSSLIPFDLALTIKFLRILN